MLLQTIVKHILPNISRCKGNQTMKSGQSIDYNMRIIFIKKLFTKCGGESSSRPISKKFRIEHISGSIV